MTTAPVPQKKTTKGVLIRLPTDTHLTLRLHLLRTGGTLCRWLRDAVQEKYVREFAEQAGEHSKSS